MEQWVDGCLNLFVSLLKHVFPDSDILALFDVSVEREQVNFGLSIGKLWGSLLDNFVSKALPFLYRIEGSEKILKISECACLIQHELEVAMDNLRRRAAGSLRASCVA